MTDSAFNPKQSEVFEFVCQDSSLRLDMLVCSQCEITRTNAQKLIEDGCVSVDGKLVTKKSSKLKIDSKVVVTVPQISECNAVAQDISIEIVYEDDDILVVNKEQGMVVHPAPGNPDKTLVNALMYHCKGRLSTINGVIRPGIVHRIDKDTSGLLVVAKNDKAHTFLSAQIKEHSFKRIYNAVVVGSFSDSEGKIDLPIGRHPVHRKKMTVIYENSKNAVTNYKTLESYKGYSLCEFRLETGRTHQIRVHSSHFGHAILGDMLYGQNNGKNQFGLTGQCLHANVLGIVHPTTHEYMEFTSQLPKYFQQTLDTLKKNYI